MKSVSFYEALLRIDKSSEDVPVLSSLTSVVDAFQKCFFARPQNCSGDKALYYDHIYTKSYIRSLVLFVPFLGNLAVAFYDRSLDRVKRSETIFSLACLPPFSDRSVEECEALLGKIETKTLDELEEWMRTSEIGSKQKASLLNLLLELEPETTAEFFSLFSRLPIDSQKKSISLKDELSATERLDQLRIVAQLPPSECAAIFDLFLSSTKEQKERLIENCPRIFQSDRILLENLEERMALLQATLNIVPREGSEEWISLFAACPIGVQKNLIKRTDWYGESLDGQDKGISLLRILVGQDSLGAKESSLLKFAQLVEQDGGREYLHFFADLIALMGGNPENRKSPPPIESRFLFEAFTDLKESEEGTKRYDEYTKFLSLFSTLAQKDNARNLILETASSCKRIVSPTPNISGSGKLSLMELFAGLSCRQKSEGKNTLVTNFYTIFRERIDSGRSLSRVIEILLEAKDRNVCLSIMQTVYIRYLLADDCATPLEEVFKNLSFLVEADLPNLGPDGKKIVGFDALQEKKTICFTFVSLHPTRKQLLLKKLEEQKDLSQKIQYVRDVAQWPTS